MSFLSDVQAGTTAVPVCGMGHLFKTLQADDPKLCEEVTETLALPVKSAGNTAISRALRNRGYKVSREVVRRHRMQECQCPVS